MPIFTLKKKNNKKHQHNFYPEDIQFSHSYVKLNYLNSWKQTKHQFFVNLRNLLIPLLFWRKFQLQSLLNFPLAVLFFFSPSDSLSSQGETFFPCWNQWNIHWFASEILSSSWIYRSHQYFLSLLPIKNYATDIWEFFSVTLRCAEFRSLHWKVCKESAY